MLETTPIAFIIGSYTRKLRPQKGEVNKMAKMNPLKFMRQVKQEVSKVTWPTRKETAVTTLMVLILGTLAAAFFMVVDKGWSFAITQIIGLGN